MKYEKEYSVVIQFLARDLLIVLVHVMIFFNFYSGQSSITRIQELAKSQQERGEIKEINKIRLECQHL